MSFRDPRWPLKRNVLLLFCLAVAAAMFSATADGQVNSNVTLEQAIELANHNNHTLLAARTSILQNQAAEIRKLKKQQRQFATQSELNDLRQQLQTALAALRSKDQLLAQR